MVKLKVFFAYSLLAIIGSFLFPPSFVAATSPKRNIPCPNTFKDLNTTLGEYTPADFTFEDLFQEIGPNHPVVRYPSMILNSAQKTAAIIDSLPHETIRDVNYRASSFRMYPIFHQVSESSGGMMIVGQEKGVSALSQQLVRLGESSKPQENMINLTGPPGTGKTLFLHIIERLRRMRMIRDEASKEFTFEWVNLDNIPYLKPLAKASISGSFPNQLKRSPLILLPSKLYKELVAEISPLIFEKTGYRPVPYLRPDPHTTQIVDAIISFYQNKEKLQRISIGDYLRFLSYHVRIVPKKVNEDQLGQVIEHQSQDVRWDELFTSENLLLSNFYQGTALAFNYTGLVLRQDGGIVLLNEFARNHPALINKWLEIIQNRRIDFGGAPPVDLDILIVGADNDESIQKARETTAFGAQLDRQNRVAFRQPLHPVLAAKVLVYMLGSQDFLYRRLSEPEHELRPLKDAKVDHINEVFTLPSLSDAYLRGPEGRYSLSYAGQAGSEPVLIAPHALELIAYTAAATRMVTDAKSLKKNMQDLQILGESFPHRALVHLPTRLRIITGELQESLPVLSELSVLQDRLEEGSDGMSSRDVVRVFETALPLARRNNNTLTPSIVFAAFKEAIDKNLFAKMPSNKFAWFKIHETVLQEIFLKRLSHDIRRLTSGDSKRLDRLYQEVVAECLALAVDNKSTTFTPPNHTEKVAINKARLKQILDIYEQVNGRKLVFSEVQASVAQSVINNRADLRFRPLEDAVSEFLLKTEIDSTTLTNIEEQLTGRSTGISGREQTRLALSYLSDLGYNRQSFLEAVTLVRSLKQQTSSPDLE